MHLQVEVVQFSSAIVFSAGITIPPSLIGALIQERVDIEILLQKILLQRVCVFNAL